VQNTPHQQEGSLSFIERLEFSEGEDLQFRRIKAHAENPTAEEALNEAFVFLCSGFSSHFDCQKNM
jgi:hypothetical protein